MGPFLTLLYKQWKSTGISPRVGPFWNNYIGLCFLEILDSKVSYCHLKQAPASVPRIAFLFLSSRLFVKICVALQSIPPLPPAPLPFLLSSPLYNSQGFAVVQTILLACVPQKISCLHVLVCYRAKTATSAIQILF